MKVGDTFIHHPEPDQWPAMGNGAIQDRRPFPFKAYMCALKLKVVIGHSKTRTDDTKRILRTSLGAISQRLVVAMTTNQVMCRVTRQLNEPMPVSPLTPLGIRRPLLAPESTSRYAEGSAQTTTTATRQFLSIWDPVPKSNEPQGPTGVTLVLASRASGRVPLAKEHQTVQQSDSPAIRQSSRRASFLSIRPSRGDHLLAPVQILSFLQRARQPKSG